MKALIIIITFYSLFFCFASGQIVTRNEANIIAEKVLSKIAKTKGTTADLVLEESIIKTKDHEPALFVFSNKNGGFMILSAEKKTTPLLGWADSGSFSQNMSEWPPSLKEIVSNWIEQIEYVREKDLVPGPEISESWLKIEKGDFQGTSGAKSVVPLLLTKWNQGCGYNALCPVDPKGPCGRTYTGCVATAMAQVIRYNQHPATGKGSSCYTHYYYGELCADFSSGNYDYAAMPNSGANAAVAKLMYHCGVSVRMNYSPSGSGAFSTSVASAMRNYFDYTNGLIISKGSYNEEIWDRILTRELDNNRPLYYSGYGSSGHAFVLDGYQASNHFHVNWGWGGSYDGYFYLNSLNPGSRNYTSGQRAIVGMIPTAGFTGLNFSSATELSCKTEIPGDLTAGTDYVNYYKNTYPATVGKEMVYSFTTTIPGRIRIKITEQTQSVYTFLLNHADKDSLVSYGTNGMTIDNTQPGTYYLIVEGISGQEPTFTVEVICPSVDADLDITEASVNPRYIQSLQADVAFNSTVKNIGNTPAESCMMDYYLSADTKFDPGTDLFIGSSSIPALNTGQSVVINSVLTMPDELTPGNLYMIFVADRQNIIPENDDENSYSVYVTVPEVGTMDCSTAIPLTDGIWYHGNTLTDGSNMIEQYSEQRELTGPELIHTFTPLYNGIVNITFVEKSPGMIHAMIMPVCNEKTVETSLRIYNLTDTVVSGQFYAVAGNQYFLVVDEEIGAAGDYSLLVKLPKICPEISIQTSGKTDLCDGDAFPALWTSWGYKNYQWIKDDIEIPEAIGSSYTTSSPGIYKVQVKENNCTASSAPLIIRMDMPPDTAFIISMGDTTFCEGGSVTLKLANTVSYPVVWARDGVYAENETDNTVSVGETGLYSLYTINGACRMPSNKIEVNVLDLPVDIGDKIPLPSDSLEFHYPFTKDISDTGGSKNQISGWEYEPVNDRFGNFWEAISLNGEDQKMYHSNFRQIPEQFSLALWFKTLTNKGGVLAAFYDNPWGPLMTDAVLYMSDNGKLHFWMSNQSTPAEISTSDSYNDGNWHCVLIQHNGNILLETDEGAEKIKSLTPVVKQDFSGYWTFGGPLLPASVNSMPSSMFFNGAFDDLKCVNQTDEFLNPFLTKQPYLSITTVDPMPLCVPGEISFDIPFSERGVEYRIWNNTLSSWEPLSVNGTGGRVSIGTADITIGINEFMIGARSLLTGCEAMLDSLFVTQNISICTIDPENSVEDLLIVYPVPAKESAHFKASSVIDVVKVFDSNGRIFYESHPAKTDFVIPLKGIPAGVYYYQLITETKQIITGKLLII